MVEVAIADVLLSTSRIDKVIKLLSMIVLIDVEVRRGCGRWPE